MRLWQWVVADRDRREGVVGLVDGTSVGEGEGVGMRDLTKNDGVPSREEREVVRASMESSAERITHKSD